MVCNKNYKNIAALTSALKKALDKITQDEVWDICAVMPRQIKAVVTVEATLNDLLLTPNPILHEEGGDTVVCTSK